MAASFKLNHADFPQLLNSTVSKPVSFVFSSLSFTTLSRSFFNKVRAISFKSLTKASNKPFPRTTRFCHGKFSPKHLHNPSQSLAFDPARNVPNKLKHYVICKDVMSFKPVALNVNFASVSVCQRVNVVGSIFCHPHISFLAKPSFTTVNLVGSVSFHPCIVLQVSIENLLIGEMRMLQVFLYHHQVYFLLLLLNLIFHI